MDTKDIIDQIGQQPASRHVVVCLDCGVRARSEWAFSAQQAAEFHAGVYGHHVEAMPTRYAPDRVAKWATSSAYVILVVKADTEDKAIKAVEAHATADWINWGIRSIRDEDGSYIIMVRMDQNSSDVLVATTLNLWFGEDILVRRDSVVGPPFPSGTLLYWAFSTGG